jgi:hypothetical protein
LDRVRRAANAVVRFGIAAFLLGAPTGLAAQAWVPPARVGDVTLGFQRIENTGHILSDGRSDTLFPGGSLNASIYLSIEYAFTDRFSVEVGLPYVFSKFTGPGTTPPPFLPVDSCYCWHGGFQDFGFIARYNAIGSLESAFALTPSIAVGAPSNNYAYQGEAVVGRNLSEVALAVDAGQRLDPISPKLSVEGRYAYAFVEKDLGISTNRSNFSFEVDYLLTRRLVVRGLANWQWTHGGLRVPQDINMDNAAEHDRLLRNDYFHAGAGVSYELAALDLYATYLDFVDGANTHKGWAVSFGLSWPFELGGGGP